VSTPAQRTAPRPAQPPQLRADTALEPAAAPISARLPLVTATPARWTEAVAVVAAAGAVAAGATRLAPGWAALTWLVVLATVAATVGVGVLGWRANRRRRILADLSNRVGYLLKTPVRASSARWSRGLVGDPIRVCLDSSDQATIGYGDRLAAQLAQATSRALGATFQVTRHDQRRARTTLRAVSVQREKPTALELAQQRVRDVVVETFGADATVDGFETAPTGEDAVTGFTVHYKAAASKLTVPAIRRRITNAVGDRLDGRWKADFALQDDRVTYSRRPPLPTFYARPTDPVPARTDPAYNLIPQAVDEDGQILNWDISGVMAHLLRCGKTRSGKALDVATQIPTPSGWTTMGALTVGDLVFDQAGAPTTVLGVYDQPPDRPCYEISFSDGSMIVADEDHQWYTEDRAARLSQRAAHVREPDRKRNLRLRAEVVQRLRTLAANTEDDETITLNVAALLCGLPAVSPWVRQVATQVGPSGLTSGRAYRASYLAQTVQQRQLVKTYAAEAVYRELRRWSTSGRYPRLGRLTDRLDELMADDRESLAAPDLVRLLDVPYWQACGWLAATGVEPEQVHRNVTLEVAAQTVERRRSRTALTYPKGPLLEALADSGEAASYDQRQKRTCGRVLSTRDIATTLITASGHLNHSVAVASALQLPELQLPVDPFVLGCWLGDGHSWRAAITTADPQLVEHIEAAGYPCRLHLSSVSADRACTEHTVTLLQGQLRALGLLRNHRDEPSRKHIPGPYLRASVAQRRRLLAGLLDTDGTVAPQGTVQYTTVLPRLADDVLELALSLGYRATKNEGVAKLDGRTIGPKWTISFTTRDPVFTLTRKLQALADRTVNHNPERTCRRMITAVRPVVSRPVRCITVDSATHLFLAGPSMIPTHNTVSLIGDAIEMSRRGFRVLVLDPKRTEFLGLRDWPNVELVATRVPDQVALVHQIWLEMEDRYRRIEEDGADESDFDPILLIIDEYRQMHANVKAWWSGIKVTGMPSECPVFEEIGSLLRMAAACRIHVDLATQRPDAEFLKGETRDNFAARAAAGRLSPDGAQMMFDSQHVGVAIPLNVRGRGTMTGMDDRPREVQFLYTPDPRRARTPEDVALLDALRPSTTRWPRKVIELPPATEVTEALDGKKTSVEWEQLLRSSLVPFDPTAARDDTDIPFAPAAGGDGDTAERRGTDRADRRADQRDDGDVDERDDVDDQGCEDEGDDEVYEGYDEPTLVRVETVEVGDLIRLHERGPWVCVELVDQIGLAYGGQVQLDWRDDDDNAGEQLISAGELAEVRRPLD